MVGESAGKQRSSLMKNILSGNKDQFYNTQTLRVQDIEGDNRGRLGRNGNNMMVDSGIGESSNTVQNFKSGLPLSTPPKEKFHSK